MAQSKVRSGLRSSESKAQEKNLPPGPSSESTYLSYVIWGALLTSVLYFWGYAYLLSYNRVFGLPMEDLLYYEVLLYSYNVIKILSPQIMMVLVLIVSLIFSAILFVRHHREKF